MRKVDRRNEMSELSDDATEGQLADYLAAEMSGDYGAWNIGIVEYECPRCGATIQMINDDLPNYFPLIFAWHDKAAEGDSFSCFVFEYLAFIAYIKNVLFYEEQKDRQAIQMLKRDERICEEYLQKVKDSEDLSRAWLSVVEELENRPLHNSSLDPDEPEIDGWWNVSERRSTGHDAAPKGRVLSAADWCNMVEFWYSVRNNLFHGGKNPNIKRDIFLVNHAFITLRSFMDAELNKYSNIDRHSRIKQTWA